MYPGTMAMKHAARRPALEFQTSITSEEIGSYRGQATGGRKGAEGGPLVNS